MIIIKKMKLTDSLYCLKIVVYFFKFTNPIINAFCFYLIRNNHIFLHSHPGNSKLQLNHFPFNRKHLNEEEKNGR